MEGLREPGVTGATGIALVCLDLAGTTLADDGAVRTAYTEALASLGIVAGTTAYNRAIAQVDALRGQPKIEVFRRLFPGDEPRAQAANLTFERSYAQAVDRTGLTPVPGAEEALDEFVRAGIRICLLTGFTRRILGQTLDTLNWWNRVDLALCPEDDGRGRPWPDMILSAALQLQIDDVRHIAVCGDTESDMLSGRRAGASVVAGVLTGAHGRERLVAAGATHIIDSVADLPDLVLGARATAHGATAGTEHR